MKYLLLLALAPLAFAQVSQKPADAIVPVVGSTQGQSNASFKTELQLTNTRDIASSGWLIYRPAGLVKRYELAAFATLSFADVIGEHAFLQQPGNDFAGIALQRDDSIEVRIAAGSAIVYATTVDNVTNDGALQLLRR
jgi:hypothetical protein